MRRTSGDDQFNAVNERRLARDHHDSAGDATDVGMRLPEGPEARRALRAALSEGENSGPSAPFDFEAFLTRKRETKTRNR